MASRVTYEPAQMSLVEYLTQWFGTISAFNNNNVTVCVQTLNFTKTNIHWIPTF